MLFPRKAEVLEIHRQLLEEFGGRPGLRDEGLLDSALLAAANRQHYEGADLAICAATYAFHLTSNHPFVDGNKRVGPRWRRFSCSSTALTCLQVTMISSPYS